MGSLVFPNVLPNSHSVQRDAYPQGMITTLAVAILLTLLAMATVWLSVTDLRWQRIPNRPLFVFATLSVSVVVSHAVITHDTSNAVRAVTGFSLVGLGGLCLAALAPAHLGGGDVKLGGFLAFVLCWWSWLTLASAALMWMLICATWSLTRLSTGRRPQTVPLAPGLFAATWIALAITGVVATRLGAATP